MQDMRDPEETTVMDPIEAMLTRDEQDAVWFSEVLGGRCFVDFCAVCCISSSLEAVEKQQ